jgi:hypothetical protein
MGCFCKFRLSIDLMQMICLDHVGGERAVDVSVQQTSLIHHIFRSRTVLCSYVFSRLCIVKLRLVVDLIAESYCSLLELLLKCGHLLCATDLFGVSWISLVMSSMWMVCAFHPSLGIFSEIWIVPCSDVFSRLCIVKLRLVVDCYKSY